MTCITPQKKFILLFLVLSTTSFLTSCKQPLQEGKYIGTYTDFREENPTRDNLWIDISKPNKKSPTEVIRFQAVNEKPDSHKEYPNMIAAPEKGATGSFKKRFNFTVFQLSPSQNGTVFHLNQTEQTAHQKDYDTHCYKGEDNDHLYRTAICINDADLSIEIYKKESGDPILKIAGSRFLGSDEKPKLEEPRELSLDEAIQVTLQKSVPLLIENQIVFQAHRSSISNRLALLPHLSFGLSGLPSNLDPLAVLSYLGDLAPFLFPAHWIRAKEGPLRYKIELDAARIIKLNLVAQVQTLAYIYARDQTNFRQRSNIMAQWNDEVIPLMNRLEGKGQVPQGSTQILSSYYDQSGEELKALNIRIQDDLYGLSLTLGFLNPFAVSNLDLGVEEEPIDTAIPCDHHQEMMEQAYRVSVEHRQILLSIALAEKQKEELSYNWFDPDGNSTTALGPGLWEQIKIAKSNIRALELKNELIQKTIYTSTAQGCNNYNGSLIIYYKSSRIRIDYQQGFEELVSKLREAEILKIPFTTPAQNLADAYNNVLGSIEKLADSVSQYRLSRTQLERILIKNRFHDVLLPDPGEFSILDFTENLNLGDYFRSLNEKENENLESQPIY